MYVTKTLTHEVFEYDRRHFLQMANHIASVPKINND